MSNEKREQEMMAAADRYADEVCDGINDGARVIAINDFCAGWRAADAHPAWVSVEERLPPKMGKYSKCSNEVLVITERKERFIAKYWYDGTGWVVSGFSISKLTHWMPLPAPPVEKGGEQ